MIRIRVTALHACLFLMTIYVALTCENTWSQDAVGSGPTNSIVIEKDVAVPMRDGVILRADIYRPASGDSFPVLLYRTPYGKDDAAVSYGTHLRAVARGYAVVLQDVRGRYASDGQFEPYRNEGRDGYDSIEWAAAQPWSNGDVGTFGLSYPGAVQWLAAIESPPHLKAMVPAMTFSSPGNFFYMYGIFDLSWLPWIYRNIAPDSRVRRNLPGIRSEEKAAQEWPRVADSYLSYLPLAGLPYLQEEAPFYFEWLSHPPEDPWWDWAEMRGRYADVDAAVLNLSGWHDEAYGPEGATSNHNGIVQSRKDKAAARSHLVIGPWTHGVRSTAESKTGDLDFGAAAAIDYDAVILRFFDQYLRGIETGLTSEKPVRVFVMGANEWRQSDTWPPREIDTQTLCLTRSDESITGVLAACEKSAGTVTSSFVAEPTKPVSDPYKSFGPHDYAAMRGRKDLLVFETPVLENPLTVIGNVLGKIYVSCNCADFDLWLKLLDVHPDGSAYNLMSPGADVLRASYRDMNPGRQPLDAGKVYELNLDGLITANEFLAGHRVRVQISASFAPHLSRNLQTGESEHTSAESKPARITIHHSSEFPSSLSLPVSDTTR